MGDLTARIIHAATAPPTDDAIAGSEASIRMGLALGRAHYEVGFHQTATAGSLCGHTTAALETFDDHLVNQDDVRALTALWNA